MINGKQADMISVRDRGLHYGDGCFETILINNHKPILLSQHLQRLAHTCRLLRIDYDETLLTRELSAFVSQCDSPGIVKVIVTRGIGGRGYAASPTNAATRICLFNELPRDYLDKRHTGVSVGVSDFRLSESSVLNGLKHLNRLDQVLASFDLSAELDEVLCLDGHDNIIEGTKSNVVLVIENSVVSPELAKAGVEGVMLAYLQHCFAATDTEIQRRPVPLSELYTASEVFMCNSVFGVWPVRKIVENAKFHQWSVGPVTKQALRFQDELFELAL